MKTLQLEYGIESFSSWKEIILLFGVVNKSNFDNINNIEQIELKFDLSLLVIFHEEDDLVTEGVVIFEGFIIIW